MTNFRLFQIERLCRRQFLRFEENGRKLFKPVENTVGKKKKKNLNRKWTNFVLIRRILKTDFCIDLIENIFRLSIQKSRLFSIFSTFIFYSSIYLFRKTETKTKRANSCLT